MRNSPFCGMIRSPSHGTQFRILRNSSPLPPNSVCNTAKFRSEFCGIPAPIPRICGAYRREFRCQPAEFSSAFLRSTYSGILMPSAESFPHSSAEFRCQSAQFSPTFFRIPIQILRNSVPHPQNSGSHPGGGGMINI